MVLRSEHVLRPIVKPSAKHWAYANNVTLAFSPPGKPTDNAYIESFNGSLREECLNVHWFEDLTDARALQGWKQEYNEERPYDALGGAPAECMNPNAESSTFELSP